MHNYYNSVLFYSWMTNRHFRFFQYFTFLAFNVLSSNWTSFRIFSNIFILHLSSDHIKNICLFWLAFISIFYISLWNYFYVISDILLLVKLSFVSCVYIAINQKILRKYLTEIHCTKNTYSFLYSLLNYMNSIETFIVNKF